MTINQCLPIANISNVKPHTYLYICTYMYLYRGSRRQLRSSISPPGRTRSKGKMGQTELLAQRQSANREGERDRWQCHVVAIRRTRIIWRALMIVGQLVSLWHLPSQWMKVPREMPVNPVPRRRRRLRAVCVLSVWISRSIISVAASM